jgi:hypothetical protein
MESELGSPHQRKIEIVKQAGYDFVINPQKKDTDIQDYLVAETINGIFDTWKLLPGTLNIWVDPRAKFVAKIRGMIHPSYKENIAYKLSQQQLDALNLDRDSGYAFASLANEIALAPQIISIVHSPELIPILAPIGMQRMEYVAPLLGVIMRNRTNAQKMMFYDYVPGVSLARYTLMRNNDSQPITYDHLEHDMKYLFLQNGIQPGDLHSKQFIVSTNDKLNTLYLLDTEGYRTKRK